VWNRFKTFDPWLYLIPLALMAISVIVIYTLTVDSVGNALFLRQLAFAIIGIALMVGAAFVDYRSLKGWWIWIYLFGIAGLILVRLLGKVDFGARRWIDIGVFQYQPGEVEKLIIIIGLAALLGRPTPSTTMGRFFSGVGILLLPVVAILSQPDLGTALVVGIAGLAVILHSRLTRFQRSMIGAGVGLILLVFALSFHGVKPFSGLMKDYQKDRLASFVEPSRDKSGSGYNVLQSVIAVGSGGVTGKGLGFGSQSQLNFLPVAHADFIFAGIAEAWGLLGSLTLLVLFGLLMSRLVLAARIAKDEFGMLLCVGILVKIAVEMMVNIGMNMRLMPVTGIPLPFLSYGGTTLLTNALCLGLVQSVVMRYKRLTF
jgi:rod shape determining protein RodA